MKRFLRVFFALLTAAPAAAHPLDPDPRPPLIQAALLLDTSNSMDGLIGQAKSQLWRVVNDLAGARRRGRAPRIEVALYEYGNSSLPAGENYIRQVVPFTSDLDRLSEKLFGLATNGGEEYCGAAIDDAVRNLGWDDRSSVYKTLFIAGNEPFTQGGVHFRDSVSRALGRDIVVNTIFCGDRQEGVQTSWKEGADRGRGAFMVINQDQMVHVPRTPYDDEIERWGRAMNDTYVAYGAAGQAAVARQDLADQAAMTQAPAAAPVERSLFKGKRQYSESAASWDAVEAVASGKTEALEVQKELPAEYRGMDAKKLETLLKSKAAEREKIQKELDRLGKAREAFLAKQAKSSGDTLDKAVLKAVRTQAAGKGFEFEK